VGKLLGLLLLVGLAAGAYYYFNASSESGQTVNKDAPRVEEKYGYTSGGVGGG
jgi:hypothetical protein